MRISIIIKTKHLTEVLTLYKYIDLKNTNDYSNLKDAAEIIKHSGLVLFPTETVYGLGANGLDDVAVQKIYTAKGRKSDNPLILHISSMDMLGQIATNISELEIKLMRSFWPGPFTIILNRTTNVPDIVTADLDTVGVRMPSNKIANTLISYANIPIAAPSANISGRPSGTNVKDIFEELSDKVDCIIDGGDCEVGLESTVVRVIDGVPTILRPGKITAEQIMAVAGCVNVDSHVFTNVNLGDNEKVLSPGMKYKHYAPNSKCILVYSKDNELLVNKIKQIASEYKNPLILSSSKNANLFGNYQVIDIGDTLDEIAKNIFTDLRKVDTFAPDIVIIEGVSRDGLGLAIMNRLIRACSNNYIEI